MGASTVDTTSQHRTHLFSNNCKICTKQQLPDDNKQEVVKKPLTTQREEHSRPTTKRVRVELETANKILQSIPFIVNGSVQQKVFTITGYSL
jgi:hypothetical protein